MNPNLEILNVKDKIVLVAHKTEPQFAIHINHETNDIHGLKVFSNGYLTSELNKLINDVKEFITKFNFV